MIFRLTHKLNAQIHGATLVALPLDENPLADWSAGLFVAGRTQYILVSNTKSLYSTVLYARAITNESDFIKRALDGIRGLLHDDGQEAVYQQYIAPESGSVRLAKALDRSVTGSMNELIREATWDLAEGDLTPQEVSTSLNDTLLSALAPNKSAGYGKPREAFKQLVASAGS
jgi:hypothetical protein